MLNKTVSYDFVVYKKYFTKSLTQNYVTNKLLLIHIKLRNIFRNIFFIDNKIITYRFIQHSDE